MWCNGKITDPSLKALSPISQLFDVSFFYPCPVAKGLIYSNRSLWEVYDESLKFHPVNWKIAKQPFRNSCLGIESFLLLNKALLGKWLKGFNVENDHFWRKVVTNFGLREKKTGWISDGRRIALGSGIWRQIRNEWSEFLTHTNCIVGTVSGYNFDCGNTTFSDRLHDLFAIIENNKALVSDCYHFFQGRILGDRLFMTSPRLET